MESTDLQNPTPPVHAKKGCPGCGEIPMANATQCEYCGHALVHDAPPRGPQGHRLAHWNMRGGSYVLDSLISIPLWLISPFAALAYLMFRDNLGGRSLGKRGNGLMLVDDVSGQPASAGQAFCRNLLLIVPGIGFIEMILVIANGV